MRSSPLTRCGALGERGGAVVLAERVVGQDVTVGGERVIDRRCTACRSRPRPWRACAARRASPRVSRHDGEHDLAVELDLSVDEHRIVVQHRADVVLAGNVGGGEHRDHAGRGAHRIEIDAEQLPGRDRRAADRDMQQPLRLADVVDEGRAAGDMLRRGVVAHRAAHDAQPQFLGAAVKLKPTSAASRKPTTRVFPRRGAADLGQRLAQQRARDIEAIASRSRADRRSARNPRRAPRSPRPALRPVEIASRSAPSRPCARASGSPPCRRRRCARLAMRRAVDGAA